ncbi:MAG: Trk system potassium transporter TrkA [Bacillota bacterium]|jgi:trk system potassium uptake protein TrkA
MRSIVIGAGKVGFSIAATFSSKGYDVTLIEKNKYRLMNVAEYLDVKTLHGYGNQISDLMNAGADTADLLIAASECDEVNIMSCFLAKKLGTTKTVARIRQPIYATWDDKMMKELGIDLIINPEEYAAQEISQLILYPEAHDVQYYANGRVLMLGLKLNHTFNILNKSLAEINFPKPCVVVAIIRDEHIIIPRGDTILKDKDEMYFVSATEHMSTIEKFIGSPHKKINNIAIFGGELIGYYLADIFENKIRSFNVKLFENNENRCHELAEKLPHTMIIKGCGTDMNIMDDENISEMDMVVVLTDDDHTNVMVSMIAKNAGAKKIIAQIRRSDYVNMIENFGIDKAISPRTLMTSSILRFINRGKILHLKMLHDDMAQMNEIIIPKNSPHNGKALKDIKIPTSSVVAIIVRAGQIIIPKGDDKLFAGDRVIVLAQTDKIKESVDYLTEEH